MPARPSIAAAVEPARPPPTMAISVYLMGRSHPEALIIAPGKGNKPLALTPTLEGPERVRITVYYPDKIRIWQVSGPFFDLAWLAFDGLMDQPRSPDSVDGRRVSHVVVSP